MKTEVIDETLDKRIKNWSIAAVVSGVIGASSLVYEFGFNNNPHQNSPVLVEKADLERVSSGLVYRLTLQQDLIKDYNAVDDFKSLHFAEEEIEKIKTQIATVDKKITAIEQSPDYQAYQIQNTLNKRNGNLSACGFILGVLGFIVAGTYADILINRKSSLQKEYSQ